MNCPRKWRVGGLVLAGAVLVALGGCGSSAEPPGVATIDGVAAQASPGPSSTGDRDEQLRQFAQCMRDHGVDVADPQPGSVGGGLVGSGLDPNDPQVSAAYTACRSKLPGGGEPPKLDPEQVKAYEAFAGCMRDNGVDLPDPGPDGTLQIKPGQLGRLSTSDPAFTQAMTACRDKLTGIRP